MSAAPKKNRKKEVRTEELYVCAARLFNQRGFHGTSIHDLAVELGVTKAAIYHYVTDKQELLYQLHKISLRAAEAAAQQATHEGRNGLERLRLLVHYAICDVKTACLTLESEALKPEHREEVYAYRRKLEYVLRALLQDGIKDGSIIPCDPKLATFVLSGAMNWVTQWYRSEGEWSLHQIADNVSAMMARSLSASPVAALPVDISKPPLTPI